jgi:hypothetical protein
MVPYPRALMEKSGVTLHPIGLYDLPAAIEAQPSITPASRGFRCLFEAFDDWMAGKYLSLSAEDYGCGGCGRSFFGIQNMPSAEFITFLAETEGLKESRELMERWIEYGRTYKPANGRIVIGRFREDFYDYLKTVTFFVNPDQLSVFMTGAQYFSAPEDIPPVIAPFGAGCMLMLTLFEDMDAPQAMIGGTDMAMRKNLPPDILAFTVTKPMYERLCRLGGKSFLFKPFLAGLRKARGGGSR